MGWERSAGGRRRAVAAAGLAVQALLAALAFLLLEGPLHASAHAVDPGVRTVLDAVEPPLPGVTVQALVSVAPQLVLANSGADEVEVLAPTGEPFLRIGSRGVLGNFASPAWYLSNSPNGIIDVPASATPGATPSWLPVSSGGSWGWYDHRLHPQPVSVPPAVAAGRATVRLYEWSVPLRFRGGLVAVKGHDEFKPLLGAITARLTSAVEPVTGIQVAVLTGRVPGIDVTVSGGSTVTVLGPKGEPFARITAAGTDVNVRSPEWVDVQVAEGHSPEVAADPAAAPMWVRIAESPSFAWIEPRTAWPHEDAPAEVISANRPATLLSWSIPAMVDGRPLAITGTTDWVPAPAPPTPAAPPAVGAEADTGGVSGAPRAAAVAVILAVAVGGAVVTRRRGRSR